ncbi:MAG TPA: response regulator [Vicinamibacterales bacterium]|nr:response regulator [Vicinamibacterales bacterium]
MTPPKPRVLIVDDQPEVLRVYARALEIDGCDTQTAASAQAAMDLINASPPDAILLDLKMPYVNGLGFLYRLRDAYPGIPVAIVTGLPSLDAQTTQEIQDLGAELAFKPMTISEVQSVARRLLARAGSR